ncbi:MAG: Bro-N domain-containing protein [Marinobacterium sp.]|nr:Bro-N domain-containing protein [Marinobacterium sp.]
MANHNHTDRNGTALPSTSPQIFAFDDQMVRIFDREGKPWFVAKDVALALEYRDAANMVRNLDEDEKGTHNVSTLGGEQELTIINEAGLYSVILTSRKPEAKRFKRWVTHEVLPSIRKTGAYQVTAPTPQQPDLYDDTLNQFMRDQLPEQLQRLRDADRLLQWYIEIQAQKDSADKVLALVTWRQQLKRFKDRFGIW